jgi:hypothetical protein
MSAHVARADNAGLNAAPNGDEHERDGSRREKASPRRASRVRRLPLNTPQPRHDATTAGEKY